MRGVRVVERAWETVVVEMGIGGNGMDNGVGFACGEYLSSSCWSPSLVATRPCVYLALRTQRIALRATKEILVYW